MSLENSVTKSNSAESKEKLPKLHFDFFFASHVTEEDAKGLEERFKETDIFIPEMTEWTKKNLEEFQAVSDGKITPEELKNSKKGISGSRMFELKMVYKSKKPIIFVDITRGQKKGLGKPEFKLDFDKPSSFEEKFSKFKEFLKKDSDFSKKREDIIISNLLPNIREVIRQRPDLVNKKDLKVLLRLGSNHTTVFHKLAESGEKVSRKFSKLPHIYSYFSACKRALIMNKPINDDDMAHALLEELIGDSLVSINKKINERTDLRSAFHRKSEIRIKWKTISGLQH